MQLARPRHARPVLGSYLNARAKRDLTVEPLPSMVEEVVAVENLYIPATPAPTVGRAWENDTFTAPVRGRTLSAREKFGLIVAVVGLVAGAALMLRPAQVREETRQFIALASTAPIVEEESAAGFAKTFLMSLGGEWSPRVFFQNVTPAFWPESAASANALAARYTEGFTMVREHGSVLGISFLAPKTPRAGGVFVLPCSLEFSDGTALHAMLQLTRAAGTGRWSVSALSIQPVLP